MKEWCAAAGLLLALLLAGCGEAPREADSAGARLEKAAIAAGMVVDPARALLAGSWARDGDRMCVVGPEGSGQRIGVVVDYGQGQGCSASGTVRRAGDLLRVTFGDCRFVGRFDGEHIGFPAGMPAACDALCRGRASLAAVEVERLSGAESEATTLRGRDGRRLCGDQD